MKNQTPKQIEITVLNWDKYNPRSDGRKCWWFKVSADIFDDDKTRFLTASQFRTYIFLLSRCRKSNSCRVSSQPHVDIKWMSSMKKSQYYRDLLALSGHGLVTIMVTQNRIEKNRMNKDDQNGDASGSADAQTEKPPKQKRGRKKREPEEVSQARRDDAAACIALYCTLFKNKYGTNPILGGKEAGIFKTLVTAHGQKKISELLEIYFVINNKYFQSRTHDVGVFSQNLNQLVICTSSNDPNNTVLNAPIDAWEELN